jgi:hypothetical protein
MYIYIYILMISRWHPMGLTFASSQSHIFDGGELIVEGQRAQPWTICDRHFSIPAVETTHNIEKALINMYT